MRKAFTLIAFMLLVAGGIYAQNGVVRGIVRDADTREPLVGANVVMSGSATGVATDAKGGFRLELPAGTRTIIVSYVGYADTEETISVRAGEETELNIALQAEGVLGQEVVVSASRQAEKLTNAPATIAVINAKAIGDLPSFNVAELLGRQRGLDYVRSGVLGIGVNARGFNSAFNPKNLQVNDGRFSTLIATGLPLGALSTTVKEDIERIEVVLGPSSALYGPNAHNGLINTITKDPRTSAGTTAAVGFTSALQDGVFGETPHAMSYRLRHAMKLSDKIAFKASGEYTHGQEFPFIDTVYLGSGPTALPYSELGSAFDEDGRQQPDFGFNSLRGEAQLYYAVNSTSDIIAAYGGSKSNNIGNTNAGRNQIKDWLVNWVQLRFVSPRFFAQVYNTWSKSDSTFAMNQRTTNYWSFRNAGFSQAEASKRSFAEQWFPLGPGRGIPLKRGALFQDYSQRLNAEAQYNNRIGENFSFITGIQYQRDAANSNGTYLLDRNKEGVVEDIVINQIGGYLQMDYKLGAKLKTVIAARADNHDRYGFNFIPKAALVYFDEKGSFRLTYGKGIAAPTILNLETNIFGGVLLGNALGFTLSDGSKIDPLKVETIETVEAGYKGQLSKKLFVDANAYYNWSKNFLSPALNIATNGRTVTRRGDQPIQEVVPGTPAAGAALVLTYLNFGSVNTYGFDASINYSVSPKLLATLNYSYFGYEIDEADLKNDGNRNGKVDQNDLPINTPAHKLGLGLNYTGSKWYGSLFGRWVQAYDFFSGINVAAATNRDLIYSGFPVVENARVGRSFNFGPLGGFFNLDASAGYRFNDIFTVSGQVTNVLNQEVREFVASPAIAPLFSLELKVNLPAIGNK